MTDEGSMVELDTRLTRSENLMFSEIDGDKVMVDIQRGAYFGLNPVAGEIWDLLATPKASAEIIQILLERYEVEPSTCQEETLAVLQRMLRLGLVEIVA